MIPTFAARLTTRNFGRVARLLDRCGSTNDEAAAWARAALGDQGAGRAPEGAVVIAAEQSGGRGRLGRRWHSPPGESLYLSLVLRPRIAPHLAPPLALVAAVALAEAVEAAGAAPELKWPNDVLLDGRKLAGILIEMATSGATQGHVIEHVIEHVIVGIGVNLRTTVFPEELGGRATSLALALPGLSTDDARLDPLAFGAALLGYLEVWYHRFLDEGPAPVVAAWKRRARLLGRHVTVHSGNEHHSGVAEDLDPDGALVLRLDSGARLRVVAGEIG